MSLPEQFKLFELFEPRELLRLSDAGCRAARLLSLMQIQKWPARGPDGALVFVDRQRSEWLIELMHAALTPLEESACCVAVFVGPLLRGRCCVAAVAWHQVAGLPAWHENTRMTPECVFAPSSHSGGFAVIGTNQGNAMTWAQARQTRRQAAQILTLNGAAPRQPAESRRR